MKELTGDTGYLNSDFKLCLSRIALYGYDVTPRGTVSKELLNYNISLSDPRNRIIHFQARKTSLKYLLGEFIWYLSGTPYPDNILHYSKFWNNIVNQGNNEGSKSVMAYPPGTVNSNYGERLFTTAGMFANYPPTYPDYDGNGWPMECQWNGVVNTLLADQSSRQAVMNIHLPNDRHVGNKDVPCTLSLQWFIRENRLHLIVNMRSNDIILGFTNDVFQFSMLQEAMCLTLRKFIPDLELGSYMHNAGSMHLYDRHYEMAKQIIEEDAIDASMIPMDSFSTSTVRNLIKFESDWAAAGYPKEFNLTENESFNELTPYWQNLVKMCFFEDEQAFEFIYGHAD
jgi:thymidylate synthase